MRSRREHTVRVRVSDAELAELRRRAKHHRTRVATFVRAAALGLRPTAHTGVAKADAWWDSLPPGTRIAYAKWLARQPRQAVPQGDMLPLDLDVA